MKKYENAAGHFDAPQMYKEISHELWERLVPFWSGLRDDTNGGYTGYKSG